MRCDECEMPMTFIGHPYGLGDRIDDETDIWVCRTDGCRNQVLMTGKDYPGLYELEQAERRSRDAYDPNDYPDEPDYRELYDKLFASITSTGKLINEGFWLTLESVLKDSRAVVDRVAYDNQRRNNKRFNEMNQLSMDITRLLKTVEAMDKE